MMQRYWKMNSPETILYGFQSFWKNTIFGFDLQESNVINSI